MADTGFIQNIATILLNAREEIRANMASKGINASGRTSAALQVVQRGNQIMLIKEAGQNAPFSTLQYGRKKGAIPTGFFYILKQWTRDKGLSFNNEAHQNAFVAYLSKRIEEKGTLRHANPRTDIYSAPIDHAVESIKDEAKKYVIQELKGAVSSGFL